jgi:hypothetical protein
MKLELKHLAAYLPYDVEAFVYWPSGYHITFTLDGERIQYIVTSNYLAKLVLRPLSDFFYKENYDDLEKVKEFIGLGKWCEAYDYYFNALYNDTCNIDKMILKAPYEVMQYFLSNHFDIYGLIKAGLAIDINTI